MAERVCFELRVRPERIDEYRERHRAVWPDMLAALRAAGWRNYSLFLRPDGLLIGYLETEDFEAAQSGQWRPRRSTPAGRRRWRRSSRASRRSSDWRRSSTLTEYAAIDLGASSGRVVLGRLRDGVIELEELHRFPNRPVRLPDGLRWNLLHLFAESAGALAGRSLAGVGIDTWGVDYGLLDERLRVLGLPFHYRDGRTEGMIEEADRRVPAAERYAVSGIQTLPINTLFQLLADEGSPALAAARSMALVPDLLALWLCGELANERTNASTTGLLDARSGEWSHALVDRLGLPALAVRGARGARDGARPGARPSRRGTRRSSPSRATTRRRPSPRRRSATSTPRCSPRAPGRCSDSSCPTRCSATWRATRTSPTSAASRARRELLKNVMGLWLEQECARCVGRLVPGPATPRRARRGLTCRCSIPTRSEFLEPGDMPARIAAACERAGQPPPRDRGETVRSILHLARLQVPPGARAPRGRERPLGADDPRDRRRRAQRTAVPAHGRPDRVRGARGPGRGDGHWQRARAGARQRRDRLARRAARGVRRLGAARPPTSPRATATTRTTTYRRFLDVTALAPQTTD